MNFFFELVSGVIRFLIKLVLLVAALIFITSLLAAGLVVALFTALWSLLTGRKPTAVTTFMRFRQASQQFRPGGWPGRGGPQAPGPADVVDVQAHEVPDTLIGTNQPTSPSEERR